MTWTRSPVPARRSPSASRARSRAPRRRSRGRARRRARSAGRRCRTCGRRCRRCRTPRRGAARRRQGRSRRAPRRAPSRPGPFQIAARIAGDLTDRVVAERATQQPRPTRHTAASRRRRSVQTPRMHALCNSGVRPQIGRTVAYAHARGRSKRHRRPPGGVRRAVCRRAAAEGQPVRLLLVGARAPGGRHRRRPGRRRRRGRRDPPRGDPQPTSHPARRRATTTGSSCPSTRRRASAGTAAPAIARAIERLSSGALAAIPVAGPWTAESVRALMDAASGATLIANVRTGLFWGSRPDAPDHRSRTSAATTIDAACRRLGRRPLREFRRARARARRRPGRRPRHLPGARPRRATTSSRPTASPPRFAATTATRAACWPSWRRRPPRPCASAWSATASSFVTGTTAHLIRRNQPDG